MTRKIYQQQRRKFIDQGIASAASALPGDRLQAQSNTAIMIKSRASENILDQQAE